MRQATPHKPITHLISNLSLVVIVFYLAINWSVVSACVASAIGSCRFLAALPLSFDIVPAIGRPVNVLLAAGNPDRATLVDQLYSFAWASGLLALSTMIGLAVVVSLRASDEQKATRRAIDVATVDAGVAMVVTAGAAYRKSDMVRTGFGLVAVCALVAFIYVFWGFYSFHGWSATSNMVHVRNRDFYMMSVGWSGLLLFLILFICRAVNRFLLGIPFLPRDPA